MFRSGRFTLFWVVVVFVAHKSKFRLVVGRATKLGGWGKLHKKVFQYSKSQVQRTKAAYKWIFELTRWVAAALMLIINGKFPPVETWEKHALSWDRSLFNYDYYFCKCETTFPSNMRSLRFPFLWIRWHLASSVSLLFCPCEMPFLAWGAVAAKQMQHRSAWVIWQQLGAWWLLFKPGTWSVRLGAGSCLWAILWKWKTEENLFFNLSSPQRNDKENTSGCLLQSTHRAQIFKVMQEPFGAQIGNSF